jgi:hypothetical protein
MQMPRPHKTAFVNTSEGKSLIKVSFLFFPQIIIAYKELIRDVHLSLKASTNSDADTFVDNLFGFERRIVAAMKQARQKGSVSKIHRLYDVKTRAHSLPIGMFKLIHKNSVPIPCQNLLNSQLISVFYKQMNRHDHSKHVFQLPRR